VSWMTLRQASLWLMEERGHVISPYSLGDAMRAGRLEGKKRKLLPDGKVKVWTTTPDKLDQWLKLNRRAVVAPRAGDALSNLTAAVERLTEVVVELTKELRSSRT